MSFLAVGCCFSKYKTQNFSMIYCVLSKKKNAANPHVLVERKAGGEPAEESLC